MDQRVIKELIEEYDFTEQEIKEHEDAIRDSFMVTRLTLKYALIDAGNEFLKEAKSAMQSSNK